MRKFFFSQSYSFSLFCGVCFVNFSVSLCFSELDTVALSLTFTGVQVWILLLPMCAQQTHRATRKRVGERFKHPLTSPETIIIEVPL